jgi:hypothetical protein
LNIFSGFLATFTHCVLAGIEGVAIDEGSGVPCMFHSAYPPQYWSSPGGTGLGKKQLREFMPLAEYRLVLFGTHLLLSQDISPGQSVAAVAAVHVAVVAHCPEWQTNPLAQSLSALHDAGVEAMQKEFVHVLSVGLLGHPVVEPLQGTNGKHVLVPPEAESHFISGGQSPSCVHATPTGNLAPPPKSCGAPQLSGAPRLRSSAQSWPAPQYATRGPHVLTTPLLPGIFA